MWCSGLMEGTIKSREVFFQRILIPSTNWGHWRFKLRLKDHTNWVFNDLVTLELISIAKILKLCARFLSESYLPIVFLFVRGERDRREWAWRRFLPVRQSKSDSKMGWVKKRGAWFRGRFVAARFKKKGLFSDWRAVEGAKSMFYPAASGQAFMLLFCRFN